MFWFFESLDNHLHVQMFKKLQFKFALIRNASHAIPVGENLTVKTTYLGMGFCIYGDIGQFWLYAARGMSLGRSFEGKVNRMCLRKTKFLNTSRVTHIRPRQYQTRVHRPPKMWPAY